PAPAPEDEPLGLVGSPGALKRLQLLLAIVKRHKRQSNKLRAEILFPHELLHHAVVRPASESAFGQNCLVVSADVDTAEPEAEAGTARVSTLELFFDLVFVFTITQLTSALGRAPNPLGVLAVVLILGVIWWMYGGYAWLTNAVAPDQSVARLLLMAGMC